ncbi:hypothetical protein P3X46_009583 [Hevea brasiliensis]|uniref:Uncharacterized protein n=1 Tax=Hevea brasiliensis TaxID=3981 RepID=A0ABQ9MP67_HEVBR|nr:hypothetical protein P3X46_009583 [Hevea brasiliensis]
MKPIDDKKDKVVIRAVSSNEEGKKRVEKMELNTHNIDTIKYRMERHPVDGLGGIRKPSPKSGHGGKYTWEGPDDIVENELETAPPAIDEKDPNYVDEEEEEKIVKGEEGGGLVVGEVEVAKEAKEGVARIEIDPHFKL